MEVTFPVQKMLWYLQLTNDWGSVSLGDPMQKNLHKVLQLSFQFANWKKTQSLISFIIIDDLLCIIITDGLLL